MKFVTFILTVFILSSCADLKKGDQLALLDRLTKTVDSISTVLIENKYEDVHQISFECLEVEKKINENYASDTISVPFAQKLDQFKTMIASFDVLKRQFSSIKQAAKEEKSKLVSLSKDIESASGEREKYDEFIKFESEKVLQLTKLLKEYIELRTMALNTHKNVYDEVYEFSFSFMAK